MPPVLGGGGGGGAGWAAVVGGRLVVAGRGTAGRLVGGADAVVGGAVSGGVVEVVGASLVDVEVGGGTSPRPTATRSGAWRRSATAVPPATRSRATHAARARTPLAPGT